MKKKLPNIFITVVLIIWLFPLFWLVLTSLKYENQITSGYSLFNGGFTFSNYMRAFSSTGIFLWLKNSFFISFFTMAGTVVLDLPIAYALARIHFKGRNILFWCIMAGMMVPFQVLIIPLYLQFNSYGLLNTFAAVVFPRLVLPIGIFIIKQFYEGVPKALEEAAFIDGASRFTLFMLIMVPLGKSAIVTTLIIAFINAWNDFLWPLIVINDTVKYPVTVGIANFQGTHGTEYALLMAGAFIASVPQFIFYAIFRKQIIAGLVTTGIKG